MVEITDQVETKKMGKMVVIMIMMMMMMMMMMADTDLT